MEKKGWLPRTPAAASQAAPVAIMEEERHSYPEQSETDPLECLKAWLAHHGLPAERAGFCVESIRAFHAHYLFPVLGTDPIVGIGARQSEPGGQDIWLFLFWPTELSLDSPEQTQELNELSAAFTKAVAIPLLPNPSLHLDFVAPNRLTGSVEDALRLFCEKQGAEPLSLSIIGDPR